MSASGTSRRLIPFAPSRLSIPVGIIIIVLVIVAGPV
jgi:hypothetical protein